MNSISLLKRLLQINAVLILAIYFIYRGLKWPLGFEALACFASFIILIVSIFLVTKFQKFFSNQSLEKSVAAGIYIGLLWTIEIGMNNIIQPHLPLRDNVDDIFWAIIACFIFYFSIRDSYQTKKISNGIKTGFLSGFASGAVACTTALILIVFGMHLILTDPLNITEWQHLNNQDQYPNMAVYFAYQTMAGALLHLIVLGAIMGLLLGIIGGTIGKFISYLKTNGKTTNNLI